jgi:hypothetical protein
LDVTKGMVNIKAGQQYMGLGNNFAYDDNATGVQITLKTPVAVRLGYNKRDENGSTNDSEDGNEDVDRYYIDLGYKTDAFAVNVFYAAQQDGVDDSKDEPTLLGVMGKFAVGPANVMAELNSFGGSYKDGADDIDYVGLQFIADVSMKFSDALTAGVNLIYSSGEDEDDQDKITHFAGNFGSAGYADLGPFNTDIMPLGADDVFDPGSTKSGAMGAGIYANFMPMEGLTLSAQYVYLTAVEDSNDNRPLEEGGEGVAFDNGYVFGVGVSYTITQNATLAAEYLIADWDTVDDVIDIEALNVMVARIEVAF